MSREKAGSPGFIHMGTISLLTVLLVVMLVVLSLLMLSGARQDYAYSQKLAQRKTEFYAAHNQAQRSYQQVQQKVARRRVWPWHTDPVSIFLAPIVFRRTKASPTGGSWQKSLIFD